METKDIIYALRQFRDDLINEYYITVIRDFRNNLKFNPNHVSSGPNGGQFASGDTAIGRQMAVSIYHSTLFDAINNELRYDKPDKYKEVISELDKISTDETSDTLYRGLKADFTKTIASKYKIADINNLEEIKTKLIGKRIHEKAFVSTTRDLGTAADFARDLGNGKTTVMQITGKKKGIEVSKYLNNYRASKEKEFIIKRDSDFDITNVSLSKTGKLILYVDMIP